jgi:hypothetical protein
MHMTEGLIPAMDEQRILGVTWVVRGSQLQDGVSALCACIATQKVCQWCLDAFNLL